MAEQHMYTNRLVHQKSPYLIQHAHNPVDWFPWGEEAFQAARDAGKPIFLSIGYATCHWCHVMERESFEDPNVAKLLNDTFVNIKIDREELPEVDSLYMEFAQGMMAGAAGWPLNVILTPELQPFFATTYLPPYSRHGLMGLSDVASRICEVWQSEEKEQILVQAAQVVQIFLNSIHTRGESLPEKDLLPEISDQLFKMADPVHGGVQGTPKFPIPYQYNFFLYDPARHGDGRALFFVERTLEMMRRGGIHDQLGGGFSRYSIDEAWRVPHFEKMLYDNALLADAYLETWQFTKKPIYQEVCESILNYVLREMRHPEGGFYSAQDADSAGKEGLFYTWTPKEVAEVLGREDGMLFCEFYGVTPEGNFEGRSVLYQPFTIEEFATDHKLDVKVLKERLQEMRKKLWQVREARPHPFKDDKVLSSWNGLMIHSMIEVGCAFRNKTFEESALRAAQFIRSRMWQSGQLLRRWREGEAQFNAGLDEYAYLIRGLISLFEADYGIEWLDWVLQMTRILEERFKAEGGAFYQTDGTDQNLLLRKSQFSDGAEPSGNAVHCENLLRLYQLTSDSKYLDQAVDILKAVKKYMDTYAPGYCFHLMNLSRYYDQNIPTIVVSLNDDEQYRDELRDLIYSEFLPNKAIIWRREGDEVLFNLLPYVRIQEPIKGKTTLYICRKGECKEPVTGLDKMTEAIHKLGKL